VANRWLLQFDQITGHQSTEYTCCAPLQVNLLLHVLPVYFIYSVVKDFPVWFTYSMVKDEVVEELGAEMFQSSNPITMFPLLLCVLYFKI